MDLKQGMEVLRTNKTFRAILSTLLSIGIFLNGTEVIILIFEFIDPGVTVLELLDDVLEFSKMFP